MARATRALGFDPGAEQGGDTRHASSTDPSNRKQANAGDPERGRGGTTHTHITDFSRSIVMVSKSVIACALVAASGTVASAGNYAWSAGDGSWGNHANWSGPVGQIPHLTVDSASVGVMYADVVIESSIALGSLHVFNRANVLTHTGSLFVNGDVLINNASLVVDDGPAQRDFDADTVTVQDTYMIMSGGVAQIDESIVFDDAGVLGAGVIEMNGSDDFDIADGSIWADVYPGAETLVIRRTGSSTAELDWTDPDADLIAWQGATLDVQIPASGSLAGQMWVYDESTIRFAHPVFTAGSSALVLSGGDAQQGAEARLEAPVFDFYGSLGVYNGDTWIDAPIVALHGTASIESTAGLVLQSEAVLFDSFDVAADGGDGGSISFAGTESISVIGGTTTIDTGGRFDLDAQGAVTVNIAAGSALNLEIGSIETGVVQAFDGTLNIDGALHIAQHQGYPVWQNHGEINLDSGEITGRTLENHGVIRGSGSVENLWARDGGEIIADGGTLDIEYLVNGQLKGDVTVETGDLRVNTTGNYDLIQVLGTLSVGDGQAIPEVVETNNVLSVGGAGSSMSMNAGFVRAKSVWVHSQLDSQGDSTIRTTGNGLFEKGVYFAPQGASTVSGTLEIDGGGRVYAGHDFFGEGLIRAAKVSEDFDFADGTDLGDVSFAAAGVVSVNDDNSGIGQASVAGFELEPTATFRVDLGGPTAGTDHDSIAVMDAAVVGGTIEIGTANGYEPAIGQVATVLTAPSISGSFDAVDDSGLGWKRRAVVSVESDRVDVRIRCAADLNDDGLLDLSDVTLFTQAFTANDMLADLYAPYGLLDLGDALAFIEMFNTGCN